ncbi:MAG TPA: type IV toxin-antitoxin system AbiEi family antitoxin domain-containing protein [Acidimicrobiales bacterium]
MPPTRSLRRALARAATQHGLLTAAQCRELGFSRNAVHRLTTRGVWAREAPGVYRVVGAPRTWYGRALAAVLAAGPDAVASHRSAAHLWGLAGFPPPGRIEVTVPRHRRPRSRGGVVVHESRAFDLVGRTRRWGVPVTSAPRVIVDLAASADDDVTVLRALDEVRRLHLATWTELWECLLLHAAHGRPGVQRCRRILCLRDGKTVPDGEFARLFLLLLARAGLPEPVSEHRIRLAGSTCRLDAAYPDRRIAIELDGRGHASEATYESDRRRDNRLGLAGWTVLRFTWRRFSTRPDEVVTEVAAAIAASET